MRIILLLINRIFNSNNFDKIELNLICVSSSITQDICILYSSDIYPKKKKTT